MAHYFSSTQDSSLRIESMQVHVRGLELSLYTAPGVFSRRALDKGSRLLIEQCHVPQSGSVLDLGCAYGVVGVTLAHLYPATTFTLSDVNERAVYLAGLNAKHLSNVTVVQSDGFDQLEGPFDTVLFNPPQTAGRDLCMRLIRETGEHLRPGGTIQVVIRHNKGGKYISSLMEEHYGNVQTVARQSGYRIYSSENVQ